MQDVIDVEFLGSYEWLEKLEPALNHEIEEKIQNPLPERVSKYSRPGCTIFESFLEGF